MPRKSSKKAESSEKKEETNWASLLWDAPYETSFFCGDGGVFRNLDEFSKSLEKMSQDTFSFHVNKDRNDFANWIYDIIGDIKLANDLRETTELEQTRKKVKTRVAYIKRKIKGS